MIFISHQTNDKDFVSVIANDLEKKYGEENIFYDDWSIKPGDSIPGSMSEALEKVTHFFYFLTENSLKSVMVESEWHSAFMRKTADSNVKFIVVRADDVNPPALLAPLKYIDLYSIGIDVTLEQMKDSIDGTSNNAKKTPPFSNLVAYDHQVNAKEINFYVTAKRFFEPGGRFLVITNLYNDEAELDSYTPMMTGQSFLENLIPEENLNGFTIDTMQDIRPGEYIRLTFRVKKTPKVIGLHHIKSNTKSVPIEIIRLNGLSDLPIL